MPNGSTTLPTRLIDRTYPASDQPWRQQDASVSTGSERHRRFMRTRTRSGHPLSRALAARHVMELGRDRSWHRTRL